MQKVLKMSILISILQRMADAQEEIQKAAASRGLQIPVDAIMTNKREKILQKVYAILHIQGI
jgi:hypothetical protein